MKSLGQQASDEDLKAMIGENFLHFIESHTYCARLLQAKWTRTITGTSISKSFLSFAHKALDDLTLFSSIQRANIQSWPFSGM